MEVFPYFPITDPCVLAEPIRRVPPGPGGEGAVLLPPNQLLGGFTHVRRQGCP